MTPRFDPIADDPRVVDRIAPEHRARVRLQLEQVKLNGEREGATREQVAMAEAVVLVLARRIRPTTGE